MIYVKLEDGPMKGPPIWSLFEELNSTVCFTCYHLWNKFSGDFSMCKEKKMCFRKDRFKHISFKIILWKQNVCAVFCWDKVIFFLVADKVLCFGFVTKPVLTGHQCFRCCWAQLAQYLTLFCFSCCPTSEEAESWGDAARTAGTRLTKGMSIPYNFVLGIKSWEKGGGWGAFRVMALVFPKELLGVLEPAFLEMGGIGNYLETGGITDWAMVRVTKKKKKRWWYVGKHSHFSFYFFTCSTTCDSMFIFLHVVPHFYS